MNDGQVALHARQDVEKRLAKQDQAGRNQSQRQHVQILHVNATTGDHAPGNAEQLHGDHVVREEVRVAHRRCRGAGAGFPPVLETLGEDEDAERKHDRGVGQDEAGEDEGARSQDEAVHEYWEREVGRGTFTKNIIDGGRVVRRHI